MRRLTILLSTLMLLLLMIPPGAVRADSYEPNDSLGSAYSISIGYTYYSYIGTSTDVDYFRVLPSSSGTLNVSMTVPSGVDYDIQLLNSSGTALTGSYAGSGSSESFSYSVTSGVTYYLKIYGYGGANNPSVSYSLYTYLSGGGASDPYEPNDSIGAAYGASIGSTYTAYIGTSGDQDFYRVTATCDGTLNVSMSVPSGLDYDVELQNSSGSVLAGSYKGAGTAESFSATVSNNTTYYMRVYGYSGANSSSSSYSLSSSLTNCTVSDPYEYNDSVSYAYPVSPGTTYTSKISKSGDMDWYKFTTSSPMHINLSMTVPAGLDYDIVLMDANTNTLTGSYAGAGQSESISYDLPSASTYYLRIYGYNNVYSTTASYTFSFTLTQTGDPFFNSIPATPPDMTSWISSFNSSILSRWTYNGAHIVGNQYNSSGRQIGCSPVEYPNIDCYEALKFTTDKLNTLWSTARSKQQDPRFYLAVLRHEGTGSFNSKTPEGDQNCGGNCADVDFNRDLDRAGSRFIPQKVRAYTRANLFRTARPNDDIFPYVGWWTPIDRGTGGSGVYATHFTWYQGIQSIYNDLSGNQSQAYSQYVVRQGQAGNAEFVATAISASATWNKNTNGGAAGTPAPNFVYHSDSAGTQPMTPPADTMFWVTNNTFAATQTVEAAPGESYGTYSNQLFSLNLPSGWQVAKTESEDQFVFSPSAGDGPVVRVFILPTTGRPETDLQARWQFKGKAVSQQSAAGKRPLFVAEGPDGWFKGNWSASSAFYPEQEPFVKIVQVTVPEPQRHQWEPILREILESFVPTEGVYK